MVSHVNSKPSPEGSKVPGSKFQKQINNIIKFNSKKETIFVSPVYTAFYITHSRTWMGYIASAVLSELQWMDAIACFIITLPDDAVNRPISRLKRTTVAQRPLSSRLFNHQKC